VVIAMDVLPGRHAGVSIVNDGGFLVPFRLKHRNVVFYLAIRQQPRV
jgi:hypothetical protein